MTTLNNFDLWTVGIYLLITLVSGCAGAPVRTSSTIT
jgi:hypothetical protein